MDEHDALREKQGQVVAFEKLADFVRKAFEHEVRIVAVEKSAYSAVKKVPAIWVDIVSDKERVASLLEEFVKRNGLCVDLRFSPPPDDAEVIFDFSR